MQRPNVIALAGPNGAGKSAAGPALVRDQLGVTEFVDADVIARGLSGFQPERAALAAGRIMLARLKELACHRSSFAFETTMASRSFAPWISARIREGYAFHVVFLWLPSADIAVARVADRVRLGGHAVPEDVIRRRYAAGIRNFFSLYQTLAATWAIYHNLSKEGTFLIASGRYRHVETVADEASWRRILEAYGCQAEIL